MKKHRKALLVSLFGTTLEYYEFTIFAIFAIQIGDAFFSSSDEFSRLLKTLALFTAGFISRPLGSFVFGHIGDTFGRRIALIITILGMSCATLAIAFTPNYTTIGVTAPILLLFFRLMQGLFIGGEGAGSAVYILEHELNCHRNIVGGVLISANVSGILIASIIGVLINRFIGLNAHSWRIAFIIGGVLGLIVGYMRFTLSETLKYSQVNPSNKPRMPVIRLFSEHWREVVIVVAFGGFSSSMSYIIKGFLVIYLQQFIDLSAESAFSYLIYTSVIFALLPPLWGFISRNTPHRRFIQLISLAIVVLTIPSFVLISTGVYTHLLIGLALLAGLAAAICSTQYTYLSDMFPTEVRYSGVAISYNLGVTFIGGFTPIISTYLIEYTRNLLIPAIYLSIMAVLYLCLEHVLYKSHARARKI